MDFLQSYKSFSKIQCVALWAGALGLIQSLIWIGLSIVSILAYCCVINMGNVVTYESITKFVFFEIYFRGNCVPYDYPEVDYTIINTLNRALNAEKVLIWTCVYLGVSVAWLISSCLLLAYVKKDNLKLTFGVLNTWGTVVLIVCGMDLAIGIMFGTDYRDAKWISKNYNLADYQAGVIDPQAVQLISAQIAAISMMIISLKGFVLWIINFGLMIYVFIGARVVYKVATNEINFIDHTFNLNNNSILATKEPINAYDSKNEVVFDNAAFVVEERKMPVELNQQSINRAARMSTDNLQERRFRNIDSFQQYPPPRQQQHQPSVQPIIEPSFPAPDYTPPMPRANQNGQLRNTRYQ